MAEKDLYMDFEDAPIEDFDPMQAGDEVAYEDEQQEMFEHYRFDIAAGQVPMRVDKYLVIDTDVFSLDRHLDTMTGCEFHMCRQIFVYTHGNLTGIVSRWRSRLNTSVSMTRL